MSQPKFTPGPWRVDADGNHEVSEIYHEICAGHGYLDDSTGDGFFCTGHMSQANANLIAAAPDMYAVLEDCEEYFDARADADHDGERYVGNAEMKLLTAIRLVLEKAGRK